MKRAFLSMPLAVLALVCMLALGACGGPSAEQLIRDNLTEELSFLSDDNDDFNEMIEKEIGNELDLLGLAAEDFTKVFFEDYSYEIGEIEVDEEAGNASAPVTIQMKSLTSIFGQVGVKFEEWMNSLDPTTIEDENALYAKTGEILMEATKDAELQEVEITFDYKKDDEGSWDITEESEARLVEAIP